MGEKRIIIDDMKVQYQGLFNIKDLYKLIENWLKDHGYDKREAMNYEHIRPEGKFIELRLKPWRTITDYAKITMNLKIVTSDLKEVEVKHEHHRMRMNQGKVTVSFGGMVETDYEGKWSASPILFFIRTIFDKYVYRAYSSRYEGEIGRDVNELATEIKTYFNMQKKN